MEPAKESLRSRSRALRSGGRKELPSLLLFVGAVLLLNLCPFQPDAEPPPLASQTAASRGGQPPVRIDGCLSFLRVMFTSPVRWGQRSTRSFQAEAKVLGKVAKVWYLKKKLKKLGKKLKKKTIAVPVITAFPIYEHSYYPQPQLAHYSHGGGHMHHAAAASQPIPARAQMASNQDMAASYRLPYQHPLQAAGHIINSYAPAPPLYVDESGGLYGQYGNAYGRYDGGYHYW